MLAVLPTGAGKSLIFQVASELLDGPVVVVSPLIALMRDQIDSLDAIGIPAARIDSSRGDRTRWEEADRVASGAARIAYCTPEQLEDDDVVDVLAGARPGLVAVDEAHAVSHWGRGFRPAFLALGHAAQRLGRPPVLALTATASPWVRHDIEETLRLRDPVVIVRGVDRPELHLAVVRVERAVDERRALDRLLLGDPDDPRAAAPYVGKGIVYTRTTRAARDTARRLAERGVAADYYHGRRAARDRERVQEAFERGDIRVVVATNAFGLGIDVRDVRWVVHLHAPGDLEAYYQEAGRAGRDGRPARCTLLYRPAALNQAAFMGGSVVVTREDVAAIAAALDEAGSTRRELTAACGMSAGRVARALELLEGAGMAEWRGSRLRATSPIDAAAVPLVDEARREAYERSRIDVMRAYAETDDCRREFILNFFGEDLPGGRCGNCDNDDERPADGDDETEAPEGIAVGVAVRHPAFGAGVVQHIGDGAITVLFENEGYRSLDAGLVAAGGLLIRE